MSSLSARERYENEYAERIEALREKIQVFLNENELESARNVQENKKQTEESYIIYPTWPFNFRNKFLTTFFGAFGSLLSGVVIGFAPTIIQVIQQLIGRKS